MSSGTTHPPRHFPIITRKFLKYILTVTGEWINDGGVSEILTDKTRFRNWILENKRKKEESFRNEIAHFDALLAALDSLPEPQEPGGEVDQVLAKIETAPKSIKEAIRMVAPSLGPDFTREDIQREINLRFPTLQCEVRSLERPVLQLLNSGELVVAKKNVGNVSPTRYRWVQPAANVK